MLYNQAPKKPAFITDVFSANVLPPEAITDSKEGLRYCLFVNFKSEMFSLRFMDEKEIKPASGTVCFIPPRTPFVIAGPNFSDLECIKVLGSLAESFIAACGSPKHKITVRPEALNAFKSMVSYIEADVKSTENLNRCASTFYELIVETVFSAEHQTERKPEITAYKIKQFIDNNIQEDISVYSIARAFYLSETHIIRIFKEKYAETPKQYILRKKIDESKRLLLDTTLQIKEIAMTFHFADSYHFSHTFKRFTGYSPEKFRMREDIRK